MGESIAGIALPVRQAGAGDPAKLAQLEEILERAAERLGDITAPVLALFYVRYPGARQAFVDHGCGYTERLEHGMVDSALYCLMTWFERPLEVEIVFADTVPHHQLLDIPVAYFAGLQEAVVDVIGQAVDAGDSESLALLAELKREILALIDKYSE
ncbi:MAG: hypothetical protein WC247_04185 [Porticoccaceae bacterium]